MGKIRAGGEGQWHGQGFTRQARLQGTRRQGRVMGWGCSAKGVGK